MTNMFCFNLVFLLNLSTTTIEYRLNLQLLGLRLLLVCCANDPKSLILIVISYSIDLMKNKQVVITHPYMFCTS